MPRTGSPVTAVGEHDNEVMLRNDDTHYDEWSVNPKPELDFS